MSRIKLGRNELCRCKSGRKYKHCCLRQDEDQELRELLQQAGSPFDGLPDDSFEDGVTLPGFEFIRKLKLDALWALIPTDLWGPSRWLFHQTHGMRPAKIVKDPDGALAVVGSYGLRLEAEEAVFEELEPQGEVTSTCSCEEASFGGICKHQASLLVEIWHALNGASSRATLSPGVKARVEVLALGMRGVALEEELLPQGPVPALEALLICLPSVPALDSSQKISAIVFSDPNIVTGSPVMVPPVPKTKTTRRCIPPVLKAGRIYAAPFLAAEEADNSYYGQTYRDQLDRLSNGLQYQFADGSVISAAKILFHPYGTGVPEGLLPWCLPLGREDEYSTEGGFYFGSESRYIPLPYRNADRAITRVLLAASQQRMKIVLTESIGALMPRKGLVLHEVMDHPPGNALYVLDCAAQPPALKFELPESLNIAAVASGFGITRDARFFFHRWQRERDYIDDSPPWGGGTFTPVRSQEKLSDLCAILREPRAASNQVGLEVRPTSRIVKQNDWSPDLDLLDSKEELSAVGATFSLRVSGEPWQAWNFSKRHLFLFQMLAGGLGSLTGHKNVDVATRRRGIKRDRDLRVLRHGGMGLVIVQETLRGLLAGVDPGALRKELDLKLGMLLLRLEENRASLEDASSRLSKLCSAPVMALLNKFLDDCAGHLRRDEVSVFQVTGEFRVEGAFRRIAELVLAWIDAFVMETQGECFLKERAAYQKIFEASETAPGIFVTGAESSPHRYPLQDARLPLGFAVRAVLPLAAQGFRILLNGVPIEELKPDDFRPEFNLKEVTGKLVNTQDPQALAPIDWFELHPKFFFKGIEITSDQARGITREGLIEFQGRVYLLRNRNLPSLKRLEDFWERIREGKKPSQAGHSSENVVLLPRSQALELLALRASGVSVGGGPRWQAVCAFYDSLAERRELGALRGDIRAQLKEYQRTGVQWLLDLYGLGLGGILADDMGLGKTLQALVFLDELRVRDEMGAALIVVPTSLTYNWKSESARFTPSLPMMVFQSKQKDEMARFLRENPNGAVVCTYGLFTEHHEFLTQFNWNIQVFDEAQNLKNIGSQRAAASRLLPARFKVCLTGTPLENHLGEFYSLMDLVVPGCLGPLDAFRRKYVTPELVDRGAVEYLRLKARPLLLRRHKSELLNELPEKTESKILIPFETQQRKLYRDIAVSWNEKVKQVIQADGESKSQLVMLTALLRLRQACSDPSSVPGITYKKQPPKIEVLMEALQGVIESGESALIFTQFLHTFGRIETELKKAGIPVFALNGATTRKDREKILAAFSEAAGGAVLLMTLKTGGVGLNLTKASYVFHLEPWWNPAVENQATDRAHRMGQTKSVQVYRYLIQDSVEEKIEVLKERKSARFNAMFAQVESEAQVEPGGALLTQKDFEYLLG